jgi:hypothetical protein
VEKKDEEEEEEEGKEEEDEEEEDEEEEEGKKIEGVVVEVFSDVPFPFELWGFLPRRLGATFAGSEDDGEGEEDEGEAEEEVEGEVVGMGGGLLVVLRQWKWEKVVMKNIVNQTADTS